MLSFAMVEEIRRLLAEGDLSQRKIARKLGVSRGSVAQILHGKHCSLRSQASPSSVPPRPTGPPQHCRTCGGMVYMPCWRCHIRAVWAQERSRSAVDAAELLASGSDLPLPEVQLDPPADLTPLLEEAERLRYEEIRLRPESSEEGAAAGRQARHGARGRLAQLSRLKDEASAAAAPGPQLGHAFRLLPAFPLEIHTS